MNLLDPVLRTANSGAVLATFKCFITLTNSMPELHPQIYARAKPPILTLVSTRDDHYDRYDNNDDDDVDRANGDHYV